MKTTATAYLLVVLMLPAVIAQESTENVRKKSISLFGGKNVGVIAPRHVSATITTLCPETRFYTAIIKLDPNEPVASSGDEGRAKLFAITGENQAVSLSSPEDICSYLGKLNLPVKDELTAYQRALVFAELLGGAVRSKIPKKKSIIGQYMNQVPENWPVIIAGTKSGYAVSFTLMTDRGIEYCVRYTLNIAGDGKTVELAKKKTVYTYTMYE